MCIRDRLENSCNRHSRNRLQLRAATCNHLIHDFPQLILRLETRELCNLGDVRHPSVHILETVLVGLVIWNETNLGIAICHLLHHHCKLVDGNFFWIADVEYVADSPGIFDQAQRSAYNVANIRKAAPLQSCPKNCNWFPALSLIDEPWQDHPVSACLTGASRI